jgi:hypothetical protein
MLGCLLSTRHSHCKSYFGLSLFHAPNDCLMMIDALREWTAIVLLASDKSTRRLKLFRQADRVGSEKAIAAIGHLRSKLCHNTEANTYATLDQLML